MGRRSERGEGTVKITARSSLRKLMRAARRGRIPDERQVIIDTAAQVAERRRGFYLNSGPERWLATQRAGGIAAR